MLDGYSSLYDETMTTRERDLAFQLQTALVQIVSMVPEKFSEIINPYPLPKSFDESIHWGDNIAAEVLELANDDEVVADHWHGATRKCPLCGGTANNFYDSERGFTFPLGLERHLTGFGKVHKCEVMKAAEALASRNRDELRKEEYIRRAQEESELAERLKTEKVCRVGPHCEPKLIGEKEYSWGPEARDEDGMEKAEARLSEMGFSKTVEKNVISWTVTHGDVTVYADPLTVGRITLNAFSTKKRKRRGTTWLPRQNDYILDNWKNDLKTKAEVRIQRMVDKLSA